MAENLMKVPVKGILKNSTSFEGSSSSKCSSSRGGMKWDEMNILATHHPPDKDYGHMKIEEPKTPFSYQGEDSGDEGDRQDLNSDLLVEKLTEDGNTPACFEHRLSDESEDDEQESPEEKVKRKVFENKRKAHYNEFMAVKLARQLMNNDEEDDEEDTTQRASVLSDVVEDMDTKDSVTNDEKLPADMDVTAGEVTNQDN